MLTLNFIIIDTQFLTWCSNKYPHVPNHVKSRKEPWKCHLLRQCIKNFILTNTPANVPFSELRKLSTYDNFSVGVKTKILGINPLDNIPKISFQNCINQDVYRWGVYFVHCHYESVWNLSLKCKNNWNTLQKYHFDKTNERDNSFL